MVYFPKTFFTAAVAATAFCSSFVSAAPAAQSSSQDSQVSTVTSSPQFQGIQETFSEVFHVGNSEQDLNNVYGSYLNGKNSGCEWFQDADFMSSLLIVNGITEFTFTKSFNCIENLVGLAEKQGVEFLLKLAACLKIDVSKIDGGDQCCECVAEHIKNCIKAIIKVICDETFNVIFWHKSCPTIDAFIQEIIKCGASFGVTIAQIGATLEQGACGIAEDTLGAIGGILKIGINALSACSLNISPCNQVIQNIGEALKC